jgi:hypothetical protein
MVYCVDEYSLLKVMKKFKYYLLAQITVLFAVQDYYVSAQTIDSAIFMAQTSAVISNGAHVPFWLFSNKNGIVTDRPFNIWLRTAACGNFHTGRISEFEYGMDVINRYSGHNSLFIQQSYFGFNVAKIRLKAGRWEQNIGNQDPLLSSGGLIWSGNAAPLPMITLDLNDFVAIPLTNGYIKFKGGISHGWFDNNELMSNALLHYKYVLLRIGGTHSYNIEYGLYHFAQWGGTSSNPDVGKLPVSFKTFYRIFFGKGGGALAPHDETINAIGNHVGSHMLSIAFKGSRINSKIYWQSIFEDGSGIRLKNFRDGMIGVRLEIPFKPISTFVFEIVNTTDQSGKPDYYFIDSVYHGGTGNDDYFSHGIYAGWVYNNMTIGTSLITSPKLLADETGLRIRNNRIKAFHTGFKGDVGKMEYNFIYTFSKNYATYDNPFSSIKEQNSFLLNTTFRDLLPFNIQASIMVGYDFGKLLGRNSGFQFTLRKENIIFRKNRNSF